MVIGSTGDVEVATSKIPIVVIGPSDLRRVGDLGEQPAVGGCGQGGEGVDGIARQWQWRTPNSRLEVIWPEPAVRIGDERGLAVGKHDPSAGNLSPGTIDIGWVGARAVPAFDAMLAPMLVDRYDLEGAVFDAGIPTSMLTDLGTPGIVGLGVLPGPLRRIVGVDHPFVAPGDFDGQVPATPASSARTRCKRSAPHPSPAPRVRASKSSTDCRRTSPLSPATATTSRRPR